MIRNKAELVSHGNRSGREMALEILEAGLQEVDPYVKAKRLVRLDGDKLLVGGEPDMDVSGFGDEVIDLSAIRHVYLIGAGKAVQRLALALEETLGDRLTAGVIAVKKGEGGYLRRIRVIEAAHPVPDSSSAAAGAEALSIAESATEEDLVITVFGSGCSSLFVLPPAGITLEEVQTVYRLAIKYGVMTLAHRVMPYFSEVNAGRIVARCQPARTLNLLTALGRCERWNGNLPTSGSWVTSWPPGSKPMEQAYRELQAEPWWDELPASMRSVLVRGDSRYEVPELEEFGRMRLSYWQPVDSRQMLVGAQQRAEGLGLQGVILGRWEWIDCATTSQLLAGIAREVAEYGSPVQAPAALISGGELAVAVGEATGIGGRNQEFVLLSALRLEGLAGRRAIVAAMDSDGTDGPGAQYAVGDDGITCLAGGIVDDYTLQEAGDSRVDLVSELAAHNSTVPLVKLKSGIVTGNTGICAGDLRLTIVL